MIGLDLEWVVVQAKGQWHLAFDRASLFVDDLGRGIGERNVLKADAEDRRGWQGDALQVKHFAIE
ncbi:hypothetical protein D3C73_1192970 [compost metagenome]